MAVARADVDYKRIRGRGGARKRLAQAGINRLANHVFNNRSVRHGCSNCHNGLNFGRIMSQVNNYLAISINIYHILARMTAEERKHRIESYLQKVEFASLEELAKHVEASESTVRRDLTVMEAGGSLTSSPSRRATPINSTRRNSSAKLARN
jgi:hypothetical protein